MSSTFAQNHTGVDLAAPEDITVLAAADGTVTEYDYNEDDGYYLVLYHGMDDGLVADAIQPPGQREGAGWAAGRARPGDCRLRQHRGQHRPPPALGSAEKQRTRRPADGLRAAAYHVIR